MTVVAGNADVAREVVAEAFVRALERWNRVSVMDSPAGGSTLVLVADRDYAYLQWTDGAQLAGGCPTHPADHSVQTFGPPVRVSDGVTAAILRGGP